MLSAISPPPPAAAPAFRIGMPPLPAFFLLLFLLAGFVPPVAAQSPPAVSLQPGGILTRMGHAVLTEVYSDSVLSGVTDVAVSDDLLFAAANGAGELSVWRVNAEAGTLRRTAVHSVDGVFGIAVGSSNLLFVTQDSGSEDGGAISVWRVNREAGTLMQAESYNASSNDDAGEAIGGLAEPSSVAVSDDLLFVNERGVRGSGVWRVNKAAGTLRRTDRPIDLTAILPIEIFLSFPTLGSVVAKDDLVFAISEDLGICDLAVYRINAEQGRLISTDSQRGQISPFGGCSLDFAVSNDLLFAAAELSSALSVWRVNESSGTLSQTAIYQASDVDEDRDFFFYIREVDGRFDGLSGANGIAVSGDLLFVTGNTSDTLSVWRVNAEAGTVSQTEVYRDGINGIDGLNGANSVVVSGDLLFVTGSGDDALSAWHINNAEVSAAEQTVIRVQSDLPVAEEVVVTVTASNGAEATVTLNPGESSAEAIFAPGTLEPGRQIFTAEATPPTALDTAAARIAMQVVPPLLSLEAQQARLAVGSTVILTVQADPAALIDASYDIIARHLVLATTAQVEVTHLAGATAQEVSFSPEQIDSAGQWEFSIQLPDGSPFQVIANGTTIVEVLPPPTLSLQPGGVLTMREHAVPSALYQDSGVLQGDRQYIAKVDGRFDGLDAAFRAAVSGDLLFVTASGDNALSVWRVDAEAGTLSQTEVYRDGINGIDGLNGVFGIELSGTLLFVTAAPFGAPGALSVWRVNARGGHS